MSTNNDDDDDKDDDDDDDDDDNGDDNDDDDDDDIMIRPLLSSNVLSAQILCTSTRYLWRWLRNQRLPPDGAPLGEPDMFSPYFERVPERCTYARLHGL